MQTLTFKVEFVKDIALLFEPPNSSGKHAYKILTTPNLNPIFI